MNTLLHAAAAIESAAAAITTAWAALGELLTAGALLLALDRLAAAIRATYAAGRWCGRLWFRYAVPGILAAADGISWAVAQVDWLEVRDTLLAGAKALIALVLLLAAEALPVLVRGSERLGRWYAALLVPASPNRVSAAPGSGEAGGPDRRIVPLEHPLAALAQQLLELPASRLRVVLGDRRRCSKAQLIAAALAC